jgi:hypothetical protein
MRRRGISETVAMKISGHRTASVFKGYDITDERDLERAAKLIEFTGSDVSQPEKTHTETDTSGFART